jgi:hypothetical protein
VCKRLKSRFVQHTLWHVVTLQLMQNMPPPGGMGYQQPNQQPYSPMGPTGYPPMGYQQMPMADTSSGGTTVFVFGILGFMVCQVFAPIAWVKGNEYVRTCAAMGVQPSGLGVAGRVLGIIGTVLGILSIVIVGIAFLASLASHG